MRFITLRHILILEFIKNNMVKWKITVAVWQ